MEFFQALRYSESQGIPGLAQQKQEFPPYSNYLQSIYITTTYGEWS